MPNNTEYREPTPIGLQEQEKIAPGRAADATAELYAKFFRGLGDPTRVRIVQLLLERPRTVGELVTLLGAPQGRVSAHLGCLRWCGFVAGVRAGRTVVDGVRGGGVRGGVGGGREVWRRNAARVAGCGGVDARECGREGARGG